MRRTQPIARLRTAAIALMLLAVPAFAQEAQQADWPQFRGPNRDGKSPDTGLLKEWPAGGPKLLWKATNIGKGFSSPSIAGGTVYITGDVGDKLMVSAFDMDGKPKWQIDNGPIFTGQHPGARSTPTIDGGKLYIIGGTGVVGCYDLKTRRRLWFKQLTRDLGGRPPTWGYAESVLIHRNLAIVTPGGGGCIAALNKNTGATAWRSRGFSAGAQYGSCIAFTHQNVPMVVAGTGSGIVGVSANNGQVLWSNPHSSGNTANCPTPAYADGYVFWATGYGKGGVCLKLGVSGQRVTATEAWKTRDMVCHHGGYIIHDGYVYGNNGGGFACIELKTGATKWRERAVGKGSLCYADGMLYLFGERGGRAALGTCSPDGLRITGQITVEGQGTSWAHPVVVGGRLYHR